MALSVEIEKKLREYLEGDADEPGARASQRLVRDQMKEITDKFTAHLREDTDTHARHDERLKALETEKPTPSLEELSGIHTLEQLKAGYQELKTAAEDRRQFWFRWTMTILGAVVTAGVIAKLVTR